MQAETADHVSWRTHVRIIGALFRKDLIEAVKNRAILANILVALVMALFYRFSPLLHKSDVPDLAIYEAGANPVLSAALEENSAAFNVYTFGSEERLEHFLIGAEWPTLGLTAPADLPQVLKLGQTPTLAAQVMYWVSASEAERLRMLAEQELTAALGQPVQVKLTAQPIYPGPDAGGIFFFSGAMSLIFITTVVGVTAIPQLMIQERQARTLDALLVSPATSGQIVIAKALTGLAYTLGGAAIVITLNYQFVRNWPLAIVTAAGAALFSVSCGLLLGSAIKTLPQFAVSAWAVAIPLLIAVFMSAEFGTLVPAAWGKVLRWVPTVALSRAFRASFSPVVPPRIYLADLAIGFGAAVLALLAVRWIVDRADR